MSAYNVATNTPASSEEKFACNIKLALSTLYEAFILQNPGWEESVHDYVSRELDAMLGILESVGLEVLMATEEDTFVEIIEVLFGHLDDIVLRYDPRQECKYNYPLAHCRGTGLEMQQVCRVFSGDDLTMIDAWVSTLSDAGLKANLLGTIEAARLIYHAFRLLLEFSAQSADNYGCQKYGFVRSKTHIAMWEDDSASTIVEAMESSYNELSKVKGLCDNHIFEEIDFAVDIILEYRNATNLTDLERSILRRSVHRYNCLADLVSHVVDAEFLQAAKQAIAPGNEGTTQAASGAQRGGESTGWSYCE